MISLPKLKEKQVAPRQIKKLVKYKSDRATDVIFSQQKRPESGRYLIQVDKQTKASYETAEAALRRWRSRKNIRSLELQFSIASRTRVG